MRIGCNLEECRYFGLSRGRSVIERLVSTGAGTGVSIGGLLLYLNFFNSYLDTI